MENVKDKGRLMLKEEHFNSKVFSSMISQSLNQISFYLSYLSLKKKRKSKWTPRQLRRSLIQKPLRLNLKKKRNKRIRLYMKSAKKTTLLSSRCTLYIRDNRMRIPISPLRKRSKFRLQHLQKERQLLGKPQKKSSKRLE